MSLFASLLLFILFVVSLVLSSPFGLFATNLVVKPEGGIVDEAGLELHIAAEPAKEAQHFDSNLLFSADNDERIKLILSENSQLSAKLYQAEPK